MRMEAEHELTKKERRELRREEQRGKETAREKKQKIKRVIITAVIIIVAVLVGVAAWRGTQNTIVALGENFSQAVPDAGREHVPEGSLVTQYNSNPPTSGPHWPEPLRDGVYDTPKPDEAIVHSLEHGRVWISYKSSIPETIKEALKKIGREEARVIVTIRDANDADIALAAWQRLDTFNLDEEGAFSEARVRDFIIRYRDKGPEYVPFMSGKTYE